MLYHKEHNYRSVERLLKLFKNVQKKTLNKIIPIGKMYFFLHVNLFFTFIL